MAVSNIGPAHPKPIDALGELNSMHGRPITARETFGAQVTVSTNVDA